ncbi:MAG: RNA polymerase sigma factor (TIGR02999 family) [Planctomycetota bacterium]|jgi:RNA polymerase sigma factor (TIGR02999 family)
MSDLPQSMNEPPDPPSKGTLEAVSRILGAAGTQDRFASEELLPLLYADLRKLAGARMARLAPGQTLQATALVHEAYMKLAGSNDAGWQGRAHFFGAAARAMRDILANKLKQKDSLKHGGNLRRVGQDTVFELTADGPSDDMLAIEEVLQEFEGRYPRKAEVVTLTFFGGLGPPEIAEVLGVSSRTVEREWRFAKAWLNQRLSERGEGA